MYLKGQLSLYNHKMKNKTKTIMGIMLGLMFLTLATAYYPGEMITVEHNLGSDNLTLKVFDNTTFINESEFILNSNLTHANITFPQNIPTGNFKLSLVYEKEQGVIETIVYKSGGSHTKYRTEYVDRNITEYKNNTIYANYTRPCEEKQCPLPEQNNTSEEKEVPTKPHPFWIVSFTLFILSLIWVLFRYSDKEIKEESK